MERYARTPSQMIDNRGDQVELCRRFINNDRLSSTKSQISPFTLTKVKKGTNEYDKTLDNCDYVVKKEFIEKTKTSKVSDKMETILSLVGSKLNQTERRDLFSAIPVVGVSQRTKQNLEVERNRELLKLPLFKKFNSPYPDGIAFKKMETEVLPAESYPIFLKYMIKGVPIPKEIEDLFDNPPDPKFYSKLLRIAIQQKVRLGEHLLTMIMSNILNGRADIDQMIQYYKNVLGRPVPELGLIDYEIRNPTALLEHQKIEDNRLFEKLLGNLRKLNPKLLKILLENYSNEKMKLLSIYSTLLRLDQGFEADKVEAVLENKLSLQDLEAFIHQGEVLLANFWILYVNLLGKSKSSDIDLEVLRQMILFIKDIDLKMDLLRLYNELDNELDIPLFTEIYANFNGNDAKKFKLLKMIFETMKDQTDLQDFVDDLTFENISLFDLIGIVGSRQNELPEFVREYFFSE
jgi:hypothetical protein